MFGTEILSHSTKEAHKMKKLTLINIGLSLLFIFAGCSDSNNILYPTDEQNLNMVEEGRTLSKTSAQQRATLQF